jgi:hypothetical protein
MSQQLDFEFSPVPVPVAHCEYPLEDGSYCGRRHGRLFIWRHAAVLTLCGEHWFKMVARLSAEIPGLDYDRQR